MPTILKRRLASTASVLMRPKDIRVRRRLGHQRLLVMLICVIAAMVYTTFVIYDDEQDHPAALLRPRSTQTSPSLDRRSEPAPLHVEKDGYLIPADGAAEHPIDYALRWGREQWEAKVRAQSETLEEAVAEYRRRYAKSPPKGFDKWWDYVRKHNVQLPDEYDQILKDLEPSISVKSCDMLPKLVDEAARLGETYTIEVTGGRSRITDHKGHKGGPLSKADELRSGHQMALLKAFEQWLPDLRMVFSSSDSPRVFLTQQQKRDLASVLESTETCDSLDEVPGVSGLAWACGFNTPVHARRRPPPNPVGSLILNHPSTMDICQTPSIMDLHAFTFNQGLNSASKPLPLASISKTAHNADILIAPYEAWMSTTLPRLPWEQKTGSKLFWRGSVTGAHWFNDGSWRQGQRSRLSQLMRLSGETAVTSWSHLGKESKFVRAEALVNRFLEVGLTGKPIQCDKGACEEMSRELQWIPTHTPQSDLPKMKYLLDVDGNAWSSRFLRLMAAESVVLKSTIFPEWYTDRIQPWYHYVPVSLNYEELLDTMVYFEGYDELDPTLKPHQDEARHLGQNARDWSQTMMRFEDMAAYMFRLYLEWGRIYGPPGVDMDFHLIE